MNILLSSTRLLDWKILDNLSNLPDTSIFLSLSHEDTQRIIKEVNPEIVIIGEDNSGCSFATQISQSYPDLEVCLYYPSYPQDYQLQCCNGDLIYNRPKLKAILQAFVLHGNYPKKSKI